MIANTFWGFSHVLRIAPLRMTRLRGCAQAEKNAPTVYLSGQSWVLLTTGDGCLQQMKPNSRAAEWTVTDNTKLRFASSLCLIAKRSIRDAGHIPKLRIELLPTKLARFGELNAEGKSHA